MSNLFKAKIITRNGVRYYADGQHAGKRVGSVRGNSSKMDEDLKFLQDVASGKVTATSNTPKNKEELKAQYKKMVEGVAIPRVSNTGNVGWLVTNGKALGMSEDEIRNLAIEAREEVHAKKESDNKSNKDYSPGDIVGNTVHGFDWKVIKVRPDGYVDVENTKTGESRAIYRDSLRKPTN